MFTSVKRKSVCVVAVNNLTSKNRILLEAERLFAEKGFDGVSVRDIAERAQVNAAMINYYFRNKDDLYLSIVENYLAEFSEELEKVLGPETDPLWRLEKFIDCYTDFMFAKVISAQLVLRAGLQNDAHIAHFTEKYFSQIIFKLEEIILDGIKSAQFAQLDSKLTAVSIMGMIVYFFGAAPILSRLPGMESYQEDYRQQLAQHIKDLCINGLSRREGVI